MLKKGRTGAKVIKKECKRQVSFFISKTQKPRTGPRILLYHSIGARVPYDSLGLRVTLENFISQMDYLSKNDYHVVSLTELISSSYKKKSIHLKVVAITFDDGYLDSFTEAAPVMQSFNFPFTVFVTCRNERYNPNEKEKYWTQWKYVSVKDLNRFKLSMCTIGSHSLNHTPLTGDYEEIYFQLIESKKILEKATKGNIFLFSYPHGIFSQRVKDILHKTGYKAACLSIIGQNCLISDPFELKRTEISAFDSLDDFKKKCAGCYDWLAYFQRRKYRYNR